MADIVEAVRTQGLFKRFGQQTAVGGVDLIVPQGSFAGLVGPNGAGKTTTLSMVTGLLRPDGGLIHIDGVDVWRDQVVIKSRIGVLPEGLRLFERLSGRELLSYNGQLRGIPRAEVEQRAEGLLKIMDLTEAADKLVIDYSTGMRKKIGLAAALLHNPGVLFLDEPFEGVDAVTSRVIRDLLAGFVARGSTVFLTSHVLEIVERLCTHVGIIVRGELVEQGSLESIRRSGSLEECFLERVGADPEATRKLNWLEEAAP
jgi:ABC-2 type transport system ATP-binding protein